MPFINKKDKSGNRVEFPLAGQLDVQKAPSIQSTGQTKTWLNKQTFGKDMVDKKSLGRKPVSEIAFGEDLPPEGVKKCAINRFTNGDSQCNDCWSVRSV